MYIYIRSARLYLRSRIRINRLLFDAQNVVNYFAIFRLCCDDTDFLRTGQRSQAWRCGTRFCYLDDSIGEDAYPDRSDLLINEMLSYVTSLPRIRDMGNYAHRYKYK